MKHSIVLIAFAVASFSAPARAEKDAVAATTSTPVSLADVITLAAAYPNLRQEMRLARIAATGGATPSCTARKLGPEWLQLKGRVVGPYHCRIGKRLLDITTRLTLFDRARHKLDSGSPEAPRRAATMTETRLVWRWH